MRGCCVKQFHGEECIFLFFAGPYLLLCSVTFASNPFPITVKALSRATIPKKYPRGSLTCNCEWFNASEIETRSKEPPDLLTSLFFHRIFPSPLISVGFSPSLVLCFSFKISSALAFISLKGFAVKCPHRRNTV